MLIENLGTCIERAIGKCILFLLFICGTVGDVTVIVTASPGPGSSSTKGKGKRGHGSDPDTGRGERFLGLESAGNRSNRVRNAEDDNESIATSKSKRRRKDCDGRYLACPFYKLNPIKHMDCLLRNQITETSFVVQHLERCHRQPIHCPLCNRAFKTRAECDRHILLQSCCSSCGRAFSTREECTNHTQARSCESREVRCEGLTDDDFTRLRGSRRHLNEAQRWYSIWDIVFPDNPHPESPYVSSVPEEIIRVSPLHVSLACPRSHWQQFLSFSLLALG